MADEKRNEVRITSEIREALHRGLRSREAGPVVPVEDESEQKSSMFEIDILWWMRSVTLRHIISFTRELSILLRSGMTLLRSLKTLAKRSGNDRLRKILSRVSMKVENGSPFWEALGAFPQVFSRIYISTVRAGEVSGRLESTLEVLAKFYEAEYSLRREIRKIFFYPVIVVAMALIVIVIVSVTVVPVFADLLGEFGAELPISTRILIAVGSFLNNVWDLLPFYWHLFLIAGIFLSVICQYI